jgi:hypothetical protein
MTHERAQQMPDFVKRAAPGLKELSVKDAKALLVSVSLVSFSLFRPVSAHLSLTLAHFCGDRARKCRSQHGIQSGCFGGSLR